MDSSYVMPFITSIQNVFETMLQMPVQVAKPVLKQVGQPSYDVSGIIGMSGDVEGSVVLSFPTATAERVVTLFTGMEMTYTHEDFPDAIGELTNMISGSAKAKFTGMQVAISCPSVVIGCDHIVFGRKDVVCVLLPCKSDCGEFAVEVFLKQQNHAGSASASAAAETTA